MPLHVLLLGPCDPSGLADLMSEESATRAHRLTGLAGIPVSDLARGLLLAGHEVSVVTSALGMQRKVAFDGPSLHVVVVPSRSRARERALDLYAAERRAIGSAAQAIDADVIHAHWTYEFAWAALDDGRPTVVTAHDAPLTILRHYRNRYRAARAVMAGIVRSKMGSLTAVSPYLAERWRRQMLYRSPIVVIPNALPAGVASIPHEQTNLPLVVLDIADSSRHKNSVGLLRAFAIARRTLPDAQLRLVGPGLGSNDATAASARARGLDVGVTFVGPVDRTGVRDELNRASLLAHSSLEESFGLVLIEAMAAGVPVLAGLHSGGVPWVLDEGRAGALVDVRDPDRFGAAIAELLTDTDRRRHLREAALRRVEEQFSLAHVTSLYQAIYEQVIEAHDR